MIILLFSSLTARACLKNIGLLQAQFIAQSIGQAFQVAYMEFLKANGIEDHSFVKEMDYQEVLNSQEIFGDELQMFAKKEMQKEVSMVNPIL
jgi:Phosphotyrosine interaction domain (PTB/PID).